jgi:hypothetical protein
MIFATFEPCIGDVVSWELRAGTVPQQGTISSRNRNILFLIGIDLGSEGEEIRNVIIQYASNPSTILSPPMILLKQGLKTEEKTRMLRNLLVNGDRTALLPLVYLLVEQGRIQEAEIYFQGNGIEIPATRRELAIAAAWYGRFQLYHYLTLDLAIPADLEEDDKGNTIAAVIAAGWMNTTPDGLFHGSALISDFAMSEFARVFAGVEYINPTRWLSTRQIEEFFRNHANIGEE